MKTNKCKRIIGAFLSLIVLASITQFSVFAAESVSTVKGPKISKKDVAWYRAGSVRQLKKTGTQFAVETTVNGNALELAVSFPAEGGIRINTAQEGYFKPSESKKIEYAGSDNNLQLKSGGQTATFKSEGADWSLTVNNSAGKSLFSIASSQIYFGYQNGKIAKVKIENSIENGDVIYGTGERYNTFDQVGNRLLLWNMDTNYHESAWRTDMDPDRSASYKNIPLIHNSRGYTLFFNSMYACTADIGKSDKRLYTLDFNGPTFDFYLWTDEPLANIDSYTKLTGRPFLPPKWAFGYWMGAMAKFWGDLTNNTPVQTLSDFLDKYAEMGTPNVAAVYYESFHAHRQAYSVLKKTNTRLLSWNTPYAVSVANMTELMPGVVKDEWPVTKTEINDWYYGEFRPIDFTHPNAQTYLNNKWGQYIDWGMRGLMLDFGEYVKEDNLFYNGMTGDEMHNFFSYWYAKAFYDLFQSKCAGDFINFERSACAGSQAWAANFSGDQASSYAGLKEQLLGILSLSSCGFSVWGGDLGGHLGDPSEELYMRWLQFSTFSPLMRAHGSPTVRNPWAFGKRAELNFVLNFWLRENLVDSLYSAAVRAHNTGAPMVQAMAVAFPEESRLVNNQSQYLFCDDFLVAPVTDASMLNKEIAFPQGKWYSLWTGDCVEGGQNLTVEAPKEQIPVYIRQGSVTPVNLAKDTLHITDSMLDANKKQALLVTPSDSVRESTHWFDEKTNKEYVNKRLSDREFAVEAKQSDNPEVLLLYGVTASGLKLDGKPLSAITKKEAVKGKAGYYQDGKITVVSAGSKKWKSLNVYTDVFERYTENLSAADSMNSRNCESILDSDAGSSMRLSTQSGYWLTVDLGEEKPTDQILYKWSDGNAPKSYKVQVSTDNKNWIDTASVNQSSGGIDAVNISCKKARYIRLIDIEKGSSSAVVLHGVEINGHKNSTLPAAYKSFAGKSGGLAVAGTVLAVAVIVGGIILLIIKKRKSVN